MHIRIHLVLDPGQEIYLLWTGWTRIGNTFQDFTFTFTSSPLEMLTESLHLIIIHLKRKHLHKNRNNIAEGDFFKVFCFCLFLLSS